MLLQALSGIALLTNVILCLFVGIRIVLRSDSAGLHPERWLALHLIAYWCLSATLNSSLHMGWADPNLALPPDTARVLNAVNFVLAGVGSAALYVFTQRIFRPSSKVAIWLVRGVVGLFVVCFLGLGVSEGFEIRVLNGPWYWIFFLAKSGPFAWLAVEAWRYARILRRRLILGLVEPLVRNRIVIWAAWSATGFGLAFSDPLARIAYVMAGGSTYVWDPVLGKPIVQATIATVIGPQILMVVALFLAFFPTRAYARWIEARGAALRAG